MKVNPQQVSIRDARETDMPTVQRIYSDEVLHGVSSWEEIPPDIDEMINRFRGIRDKAYPYLVAEVESEVGGYCYATSYRPRVGYRFTVENTIYVDKNYRGLGLGRLLMEELVSRCESLGFRQMVAVIGDSHNRTSIEFHARMGFRRAGVIESIGFKHGRWMDSVIMQRQLGEGDRTLPK